MMSGRVGQPQQPLLCAIDYPIVSTKCLKWKQFGGQWRKCNANISNPTRSCYRGWICRRRSVVCHASRRKPTTVDTDNDNVRGVVQFVLWTAEAVYILWLFLLPYAPGDPVWAISSETVDSLVGLSLNFFFILPLMNSVGIRVIDAPVLHPISEGLFNFVIGWTFMFAPLLFTDCKRDRYKGSLDVLWGFQLFLTNSLLLMRILLLDFNLICTDLLFPRNSALKLLVNLSRNFACLFAAFLIPYMAIRLNDADAEYIPRKPSQLALVMTNGAPVVGLIGGAICLISTVWALYGRMDGDFGSIADRWEYLVHYLGSERLAYAFIWDICFYIIFQPWLIGDNLQNIETSKVGIVNYLRFLPGVGLIAYLLFLNPNKER